MLSNLKPFSWLCIDFVWRKLGLKELNLRTKPNKGRFPFVRTDRPDHSRRNENFTVDQNYLSRSVKS